LHFKEVPKRHSIILLGQENRNQSLGLRLDRVVIPDLRPRTISLFWIAPNKKRKRGDRLSGRKLDGDIHKAVTSTSALARA
jgi:hypothetical protein